MNMVLSEENRIRLYNFQIVQQPPLWDNLSKYMKYLPLFTKVRKNGVVCEFSFLSEDTVRLESVVEGQPHHVVLTRVVPEIQEK
jgi:hypothetical protein